MATDPRPLLRGLSPPHTPRRLAPAAAVPWILVVLGCGPGLAESNSDLADFTGLEGPAGLLGPVIILDEGPPPIHGGTLLATRDGRYAVVGDPDRHRVSIVELERQAVREVALEPGLELGRMVEDGAGRVYVVARRAGRVVAVDVASATVQGQHEVCAAPRGLTWEAEGDRIHVACADGTLVSLGPERDAVRRLALPPDLRDVVVTEHGLLVSRMRRAEAILVLSSGEVAPPHELPLAALHDRRTTQPLRQAYRPNTAVRLVASEDGALILHQRARVGVEASRDDPPPDPEYGASSGPRGTQRWVDPCENAVAHVTVTSLDATGRPRHVGLPIPRGVTPTDLAVSPTGRVAVAFAGALGSSGRPQVFATAREDVERTIDPCMPGRVHRGLPGQVVSVAFAGERLLVQLRSPARLVVEGGAVIELGGADVVDTGHDVFHLDGGGAISCATCHPGGGDDGHVWELHSGRPVRTQSLEGTVGVAPYHRAGDEPSFESLMSGLAPRMGMAPLGEHPRTAAERWLEALAAPPAGPRADADAVERGRRVFEAEGCGSCHTGSLGTDRALHDVGTWRGGIGERGLITPALAGVALRAPFLHDGRAASLSDALAWHGAALDGQAAADLVAYVESR